MKTLITALLTAAVVLAGTAAIVSASGGSERRVAGSLSAVEPQKRPGLKQAQLTKKCKTLKCINNQLKDLNNEVFKCEQVVPVTQYDNFAAVGGGATTGLDFTAQGDQPSEFVVVEVCG